MYLHLLTAGRSSRPAAYPIVSAILDSMKSRDDGRDEPSRRPSPAVEGDNKVWPGEWGEADIDVVFTPDAHRAIRAVAGCEDHELRLRIRQEQYAILQPGHRGQDGRKTLSVVLMCDPRAEVFFKVRLSQGWHDDGTPRISVVAIWPAVERLAREPRRDAARLVMSSRQYEAWLTNGEITARDLPRWMRWFEEWAKKPDHLVRVEDLLFKRDRINVNLVDAAGKVLHVGPLPQSLRNRRRDLMVQDQDFWEWIDKRLQDMRSCGLMKDVEMSVEDISLIEMRNVRGLPKTDGTRTDPVIRFEAWSRP